MILVTNGERASVAVDYLDAATEVVSEVELGRTCHRNLLGEVEKSSGGSDEGLQAFLPAKVKLQTYWRGAGAVDTLATLLNRKDSRT